MFGFLFVLPDNHIIIINDVCVWLGTVNTGVGYTAALTHIHTHRKRGRDKHKVPRQNTQTATLK